MAGRSGGEQSSGEAALRQCVSRRALGILGGRSGVLGHGVWLLMPRGHVAVPSMIETVVCHDYTRVESEELYYQYTISLLSG